MNWKKRQKGYMGGLGGKLENRETLQFKHNLKIYTTKNQYEHGTIMDM